MFVRALEILNIGKMKENGQLSKLHLLWQIRKNKKIIKICNSLEIDVYK